MGYSDIGRASHATPADDVGGVAWRAAVCGCQWAWYRGVVYPAHGFLATGVARLLGNRAYKWWPAASLLHAAVAVEAGARLFPGTRYLVKRRVRRLVRRYQRWVQWVTDDPDYEPYDDDWDSDWDSDTESSVNSMGDMGVGEDWIMRDVNLARDQERKKRFPHRSVSLIYIYC